MFRWVQEGVKVGIEEHGGSIEYTLLEPIRNARVVIKISSTLVNNTWTAVSFHEVVNGTILPTPLAPAEPYLVR